VAGAVIVPGIVVVVVWPVATDVGAEGVVQGAVGVALAVSAVEYNKQLPVPLRDHKE
jgi:hypothetical protein